MIQELVGLFIEAGDWIQRIIGLSMRVEYGFHAPHEVRPYLGGTPTLNLPRGQASSWVSVLPKKV